MQAMEGRRRTTALRAASWAVGCLFVGVAAVPAHAESIRSQQWHLDAMHADEMWETSTGQGVTVAVIDTGVDDGLADLRGQVLEGRDFSGQPGGAHADPENHGTQMAALIAGTGKRSAANGSFGLAPDAKILPLRVTNGSEARNEAENKQNFARTVSAAVRYAADSDAKILNISMGNQEKSPELEQAVQYALEKGKLIFAAVGNSGDKGNDVEYPAGFPGVLGVAANNRDAYATKESQHGPQVALAAPGEDIVTACVGGTELCKGHGTSAATALVSASAALIWSVHPTWTANQIARVLINTAGGNDGKKERSDFLGYGAVRPRIALKNPGDPGPADVSPLPGVSESKSAAGKVQKPTTAPSHDEGDSGGLDTRWLAAGVGAAAVLAAAVTALIVFARRSRRRQAGR
ncbi:type VII secretion-associated serine protease mycosin [Streptomyces sp. UNOC14_S4]|uniref:type VII secretion-associated serine protease mycosin n=1 Tax=Streptomyces sp. UNOC14_S4 TaxID=2872340 RepID=UPI001E2B16BF|nr:type VII secretion-associated serine protease mycosin [Streptomyces sp. UNOC14_S4]